ncbi:MAG TPA: Nif3-like dinuclear metal center hexameric protein [Isosphaeraceae bacterium]
MTTVAELAAWLEDFAPRALAEPWDNVGLLWGDPASSIERIMTCLTVTPTTADEAVEAGVGAIVSHHPVLFKPVQAVRADSPSTGYLWRLARAGTAVLSPHTSFDNTRGGINDGLADRLGLRDVRPLRAGPASKRFKVVVFVPPNDREAVLSAAFASGAGRIGAYDECSFTTSGRGTFFGTEGANPTVGEPGRRETVREWRVEAVCPGERLARTLAAIRSAHSYEEPAIDVYPLADGPSEGPGVGRVGTLPEAVPLSILAGRVKEVLGATTVQYVGDAGRAVSILAVACGAGDDFLPDARREGAHALLTGEARFHRALEADALGIGLIVAGHHATERPGVEDLARRIAGAFPGVEVWASRREADPLRAV